MIRQLTLSFAALLFLPVTALSDDRDRDGISDRHEAVLGSDSDRADRLQLVIDDGRESDQQRAKAGYDATKDVVSVEFGHVAEDRYLWRWTVVEPARPEDTVFHLYVDADADETTGRKGSPDAAYYGTDYMLTVAGGSARTTVYDAKGNSTSGPPLTYVVDGNQVLVSADIPLVQDDDGIHYGLYMLCHTASSSGKSPAMSDSSSKLDVRGMPIRAGKKIMRPRDHRENFQVSATYGTETLQRVLADERNVVVPHDELTLDGFVVDPQTTRKWPHISMNAHGAIARTTEARPGRFHVGFMMYDERAEERVVISVDGKLAGVAVARLGTRRTWLYWLERAIQFTGNETIELKASGSGGRHGISCVVLMPQPPEPRRLSLQIKQMTALADPDRPGRVTLSWTTSWPCPTKLVWGENGRVRTAGQPAPYLVHRVVLDDFVPAKTYTAQAVGLGPNGEEFVGETIEFRAEPVRPRTAGQPQSIALAVGNPHGFAATGWPVTGGVPFPRGVLDSADQVRLVGAGGEIPLQVLATARWPDGGIKWLLLNFTADVQAASTTKYRLEFGGDIHRTVVANPVRVSQSDAGVQIDTGKTRFSIDASGNIHHDGICQTIAEDTEGTVYSTGGADAETTIEEAGPVRVVIKTLAPLIDANGNRLFRIEKRIEAYRGVSFVRIHHTLVVDRPDLFTKIRRLSFHVPIGKPTGRWRAALVGKHDVHLDPALTIRQQTDERLVLASDGRETIESAQMTGSLIAPDGKSRAVAVRDAWQNYPKGFAFTGTGLDIGLCPTFEKGFYDQFPFEKEGHHRFYYLLEGCYKLKRGMAKTHELLLSLQQTPAQEQVCHLFQQPLLLTVPPAWMCASKAFYDVAPQDARAFTLYEAAIDKNLDEYARRRARQHDFGMLNFGDWYGERGTNWGNVEYDTQNAFFLEYVRSGDPRALVLGCQTELHNRDIDTVHWSDDPSQLGGVYVHQMCHVGDYYDQPVPGALGYPRGGFTVSHAWTEGHFSHYFLTGDRRSRDTGCAVADHFIRRELSRPYDFSSTRTPGWHLIMLCSAYHSTSDPYYLNAAHVVVKRVLEVQDKLPRPLPAHQREGRRPYQDGGWVRMMVPGHCHCQPRHQGNAGFMIAVLLSGLKYYHDITGDERVKESIIRGAHYLLDETYSDESQGFRYTSCPEHGYRPGATPLMVEGIARAYWWTKEDRFRRVLTEALPRGAGGSAYGKGFSMYYRMAPRVLADLKAAGIELK